MTIRTLDVSEQLLLIDSAIRGMEVSKGKPQAQIAMEMTIRLLRIDEELGLALGLVMLNAARIRGDLPQYLEIMIEHQFKGYARTEDDNGDGS
jgi:hypothetical protein